MWQNREHQNTQLPINDADHHQPTATSTVGLPMPIDQTIPMLASGSSFYQDLLSHIRDHNVEIDALLNRHRNVLRAGIQEMEKRHLKSLIVMLERIRSRRVREKDVELENAKRRNSEMEKRVFELCSENEILRNLVCRNEALASRLKAALDQVIIQNADADAEAIEGYGDNNVCRRMACKVCLEKEMCVLVLQCRHLCLCEDCETKVGNCPICKGPKEGSVQIFMP